jgi:uncharacterized protein
MIDRIRNLGSRSYKDILVAILPVIAFLVVAIYLAIKFVNPAPPNHLIMTTGDPDGDYFAVAKHYQEALKEDGIELELKPSSGSAQNLERLIDDNSDVDIGFVQDGLGTAKDAEELVSLGSLYYEPIWVFYRGKTEMTRFTEFKGKRIAIGEKGDGIHDLAKSLLKETGIDEHHATFIDLGWDEAANALKKGDLDVAFFIASAEDPFIETLMNDRDLKLMNVDQAEAISRQYPYLHHLVLPHGVMNLKDNIPDHDIHVLAPTVTLLAREDLHPALMYLLLKAAVKIHSGAGIMENKDEFPIDKDFIFPLSPEAKHFYKSGAPFWQRYMPFWLATIVDRFIVVVVPLVVLLLPLLRTIPRVYAWRIRTKIFKCYGELKFLETQMRNESDQSKFNDHLKELDRVEERVNKMKVPLPYAEHIYSLRGHIHFVREQLPRV